MQRIMIFGRPGSGKSTYALKLQQKLGLPLYHLDRYFFIDNWVERDEQEFLALQKELVDQDAWIIDGNCTASLEMRYQRAQLCLYFNYPKALCYFRIFKRRFKKDEAILDRPSGCKEKLRLKFLSYIWNFDKRAAVKIAYFQQKYPQVKFIEIKSDEDLQKGVI
jgi:adenylate kinase family enzyme